MLLPAVFVLLFLSPVSEALLAQRIGTALSCDLRTGGVAHGPWACLPGDVGAGVRERDPRLRSVRREESAESVAVPSDVATHSGRRDVLRALGAALPVFAAAATSNPTAAGALPFLGGGAEDRRQLEFCLVNVLRVQYWAETVSASIGEALQSAAANPGSTPSKSAYVEARLGSKALLTGRVGGGANARVFGLSSLQIKGCLKDAQAWYGDSVKASLKANKGNKGSYLPPDRRRDLAAAADDVTESLAACVEFDGLDNTQDPSPRSTLMVSQFTSDKATFVRRTLAERTVPACRDFAGYFGTGVRGRCEQYVKETYPNEVPRPPVAPAPTLGEDQSS